MNFEIAGNKGERYWGASSHAIEMFIERNRFLTEDDWRDATITLLKMMNNATYLCRDLDQDSDVYASESWILICKDSTIVTVYPKKDSKWRRFIV